MPDNVIRFYRAKGEWGFLSNLFVRELRFGDRNFRSAEDAYQFGKPRDIKVAEWLIAAPKPHLCAAAAHSLFVFDVRSDWSAIKVERMRDVLLAKFIQHSDLASRLLATEDAVLIEESKSDGFWGVGAKGKGKNMLGTLLTEVRAELNRLR